jgi:hypothetical protein
MIRAEAEPLPEGTPGYGRIVVTGIGAPPGSLAFTLRREGFALGCLGPRGWQAGEETLQADLVAAVPEAGGWAIVIGPDLSRYLRPAPYLLGLPALGAELAVFWPDGIEIPVAAQALPSPPPRAAAPQRWPDPPPAAQPAPSPPAPAIGPEARLVPPVQAPAAARRPWPWIALGAVLLLGTVGVLLRDTLFPPTPGPNAAAPATMAPPAQPVVPPTWPEGTDSLPLRDLVAIAPDAAGIRLAAERRQRAGRHDDALALFEEAANRGDGGASLALARLYDPVGFTPGRPFRTPDAFQAARHYQDAARRGAAAEAPRAALRAHLEARPGDAAAAAILREFWP